jgi:hypothetical protein
MAVQTEHLVIIQDRSIAATGDSAAGLLASLCIAVFAVLAVYQWSPPETVPATAPATEFSAQRAMKHLEVIAARPHPIGSSEHARIRDYIVSQLSALQLNPEIQKASVVNDKWGAVLPAATVENVVAKLKGTDSNRAILIAAHYDSMPNSPGASDDGSAVAAMLEAARVLRSTPSLRNDVIFLFTDGEEAGLLGAKAFVDEHAWRKDIGLVLNFEARGDGGPTLMFETSSQNGWLIKTFAGAARYPVASSYMYDVYKLMPNSTDFTVFREAGFPGFNFAFISGSNYYHGLADSIEHTNQRSLQHHGSYMLALTRAFGNLDLRDRRETNAVYFDLFGLTLVHYSAKWTIPLTFLTGILVIGIVFFGLKTKQLTRGVLTSFMTLLFAMIGAAVIVKLLWFIVGSLHRSEMFLLSGDSRSSHLYLLGFVAVTIAIVSECYVWSFRKLSIPDLATGILLWWLLAMLAATFYLPGAAYLFTWPLLFSLLSLGFVFVTKNQDAVSLRLVGLLSIGAIAGMVLLVPTVYALYIGLGLSLAWALMLLVVLLLGLAIPCFNLLSVTKRWLAPGAAALMGLLLMVAGSLTSHYSRTYPKPNSVFYLMNSDSAKAIWATLDESPDAWTAQFFPDGARKATISEYLPSAAGEYLQSPAPLAPLPAPNVVLLGDSTSDNIRTLRLRISSPRQAPVISVYADKGAEVLGAEIGGKKIENDTLTRVGKQFALRYYAPPPEGVEIGLQIKPAQSFEIKVVDHSYGLTPIADAPVKARPDYMMPTPIMNFVEDATMVSKSFTF